MLNVNFSIKFAFYLLLFSFQMIDCFAVGVTTRISTGSSGTQTNDDSVIGGIYGELNPEPVALSANGRFVAFNSAADNLVLNDTNKSTDVFVFDRLTGITKRVNVSSSGNQSAFNYGNCVNCSSVSLSADGRFAVFNSDANNLVSGDTNNESDIFVHDSALQQTTRVNVSSNGTQATKGSLYAGARISADGRYVAFVSPDDNLVNGDTNSNVDVFVRDLLTKQTTRVSVGSNDVQANLGFHGQHSPDISADGRFVVFVSDSSNLVSGDTNDTDDIFVHDRQSKETIRISLNSKGQQSNSLNEFVVCSISQPLGIGTMHFTPSISANGRFVTFASCANNLVNGDTNDTADIFVHDRQTKITTRVSVDSGNIQANKSSYHPMISANGRYVVFSSSATNLVANDTNNGDDVFIHDRLKHKTFRINIDSNGNQVVGSNPIFGTQHSSISADGRFIIFDSDATNLVNNDTNNATDIFVRDTKLFTSNPTDLEITTTASPVNISLNGSANYTFTVINKGSHAAYVSVMHIISNGEVILFKPSQGKCSQFSIISKCYLELIQPGASVALDMTVKALRNSVSQQLTLFSGGQDDPLPKNNYLNVRTNVVR
jgi:Domain of unknown function DUF11/WD40-like Beta Propeller Repeat